MSESNDEKIAIDSKKEEKLRIRSIDILKGVAIVVMIGGHTMNFWTAPGGEWMYAIMYLYYCSILTSLCFVMMAGVTLPISYFSKLNSGWSVNRTRIHILKRTLVLLVIGIIYNIIIGLISGSFVWNSFFGYYSWYVLQLIAISLIITLFLMPLNKYIRLIIGIIIILISTPLYNWLTSLSSPIAELIEMLIFNPFKDFPLLPWVGLVIIGSVVGETFYNVFTLNPEIRMQKMREYMKNLVIVGAILLCFGLFTGLQLPGAEDPYWYWYAGVQAANLSTNPFLTYGSLPYFMLVGHWTYMFYGIGGILIILAFLIYLADYIKFQNKLLTSFGFTGKFAFSIFLYHHIGIPFLIDKIPVFWIWEVVICYLLLVPFLVWLVVKYLKGIGTLEWLMVLVTAIKFSKPKKENTEV